MVMSAWNPIGFIPLFIIDIGKMALPPCHAMCQFYGLGVPFNIASYSLLTHMIAHLCNLKLGDFVHSIGDSHVYLNHIEPLQKQVHIYNCNN
ncbi:hypothetical protein HZS_6293 [Henneguya salminicola]|nr:hypothetical protein HZS_6293 [Henneguya salminicola]